MIEVKDPATNKVAFYLKDEKFIIEGNQVVLSATVSGDTDKAKKYLNKKLSMTVDSVLRSMINT